MRELRPVPGLRRAGRGVQAAGGELAHVKRGAFEARLLLLVSFGLVAFGLVMVYSATSASAALENGDPAYYVKRQAIYAAFGLVLMVLCARFRFQALRLLAPVLVVSSLCLLAAVVGLGQSVQKANFLPEAHTDMIFAIVGEELGLVGTTALVAAYITFAYVGLRIALRCRDPFGKSLATGLTLLVCGQAAINIAAVMGLAPLTGIPLPFVSYGGSSLIVTLAVVGILLNIALGHGAEARAQVRDRGRGDGGTRAAGARRRRSAPGTRRPGQLRRAAGSHRGAAR